MVSVDVTVDNPPRVKGWVGSLYAAGPIISLILRPRSLSANDSRSTCQKTMRVNWITQPWKHFGYAPYEACKTAKAPRVLRAHYGSLRVRCIDGWRSTVVVDATFRRE